MTVIHPITRKLQRQIADRAVSVDSGAFDSSLSYRFSPEENGEYAPHLEIRKITPYRRKPKFHDEDYRVEIPADLVNLWEDKVFSSSKRAIRTISGLLGPGQAKIDVIIQEMGLDWRMMEDKVYLAMEKGNARPRPFPNLLLSHQADYKFSRMTEWGDLEDKLPWFRYGTFVYETPATPQADRSELRFRIDHAASTLGTASVRFSLPRLGIANLPAVNAVAWYLESLPRE